MAAASLATTLILLAFAAPSFAATTVHDCPVTGAALNSDIAAAGNGGTVAFDCAAATTIPFDVAHGGTGTITIGTSVTLDASGSTGPVTFDGGGSAQLLVVNAAASLTVNALTLRNGYTQYGPGAIRGIGTVTVIDSTVSGNGGWGAVSNEWGNTLTITGSTFSGNSNPGGYGGAILQNSPDVRPTGTTTITGSTFSNNSVEPAGYSGAGGAINIQNGTLNITGSTFSGNSGGYAGGAIMTSGTATVETTTFSGNSVSGFGGAITTAGTAATTTITKSVFSANTSSAAGGALDNQSGATTNVSNSSLIANTAPNGGGAIYSHSTTGAAGTDTATLNVADSTLSGNSSNSGGAIYNYNTGAENSGKLTVSGSTFAQNRGVYGGAIENGGSGSALTVRNTTFSANGGSDHGGTLFGGAIFNYSGGSTATITGSTFAGNVSRVLGAGAAIANYSGNTLTIGATLIQGVPGAVAANCYNAGTIVDSGYNLSNDSGAGCGFSPIFRHDLVNQSASLTALGNNGGPTQTLALQLGSPAIDYVPLSTGLCGATDQRGFLRPDPGETACDIGAYEFQDQATVTALSSSQNPSTLGQAVTFTATVSPQSGTATPAGTVQFQVDGSDLGSAVDLSGGTAQSPSVSTLSAAGSPHTITASYTPAPGSGFAGSSKSLSQAVAGKTDQTIAFTAPSGVTYGDADLDLGATASSGLTVAYTSATPSVCTIDAGNLHVAGAGSCTIDADQAGNDNYDAAAQVEHTFTIARKAVHVDATSDGKTYGQNDPDVTGDYLLRTADFTGGDDASVASGSATCSLATHSEDAGTHPGAITCDPSGLSSANYAFVAGDAADFTIAVADQTVTFKAPSGVTYGDADFDPGATASSGLGVGYSASAETPACTIVSGRIHVVATGDCTVTASQGGNSNFNAAPDVTRTFTIAKAGQTIAFTAPSGVTYGDADLALGATASSGLTVAYASTTTSVCTIVAGKLHVAGAGSCTIDADQAGNDDYGPAAQVERTFAVAKAVLTITAADKTVQYSDPLPALTAAYSGFVGADGPSALGGALSCTTAAGTSSGKVVSPAGTYGIACSGLSSSTYTITSKPGTLTVTREDALVRLAQNNPHAVQVDTSGANKGKGPAMTFTARITERSDGSYGDIAKATPATFTLSPVGGGSTITCSASVTQLQAGTAPAPGSETVSCTVPKGAAITIYEVTLDVGGSYYKGSDSSVLSVYDPSAGGSNGGGTIANPANGNPADISYTATFQKNGQVQGKLLYIQRDADGNAVHVLKGNVMSTMAINANAAAVTGKATLDGVGNYSYVLSVVDNGNPSPVLNPDRYGQRVSDPAGSAVAELSFDPVVVVNGNVFVGK